MAYTTLDELQKDGNVYDYGEATAAIEASDTWIDKITSDHFELIDQTLLLDGSGTHLLSLLSKTLLKVIEITSVVVLDPLDGTDEIYSPTDKPPDYYVYDHFLKRSDASEVWPTGFQNIQVIGSFGWVEVPGPIKNASAQIARMFLDPDSELEMTALSVRIGDLSFTRQRTSDKQEQMTGIPGVDRILRLYLNPALMAPTIV